MPDFTPTLHGPREFKLAGIRRWHDAPTPDFERYDERFDPVTRGPLEIWFPIESPTGVI